jgi:integrase/recombinase XerD
VLTLYRRHRSSCPHADDRYFRKCRCAVWCEGTIEGKYLRQSLKTRSWERGEELKKQLDVNRAELKPKAPITVTDALDKFIADCESRNLNTSTLAKYKLLRKKLEEFARERALLLLGELDSESLRAFRQSWKQSPRTSSKMLERLRSFFNYAVGNGWLPQSPARPIKAPETKPSPTLPFSIKDVQGILANTDSRSSVFFRVLLHSGLRIVDAAMLTPDRLQDGKLFLYQQKTGVPVRVPLPPDLSLDLSKLTLTGGYYFILNSDRTSSVADRYRRKLAAAGKAAGVSNAHPHRFRDTFAVRLLEKGVPLETVSILLGHTDVKTTQRNYAPWVKSLQDNLEKAVALTWQKPKLVRVK